MKPRVAQLDSRPAWNRGRIIGQKAPLKLEEVSAIRVRPHMAGNTRHLALFDLALDRKLGLATGAG